MLKTQLFWHSWRKSILGGLIWLILVVGLKMQLHVVANQTITPVQLIEVYENAEVLSSKVEPLVIFLNRIEKGELNNFNLISLEGNLTKLKITGQTFSFHHLAELMANLRNHYKTELVQLKSQFPYFFQLEIYL